MEAKTFSTSGVVRYFSLSLLLVIGLLTIIATGGGGGGGGGNNKPNIISISGVASAGAPIAGIVNVKGASGNTSSSPIDINGSFSLNVTALTAPYILYAEGTVGDKTIKLYSAGVAAGTINITPITDFILRNALHISAESAYTNWETTQLTEISLSQAESDTQTQLTPLLEAMGIASDIDLISTEFSANHTGLDQVLDAIDISYEGNQATVTNRLTGSHYTDDITLQADGLGLPESDAVNTETSLSEQEQINQIFLELTNLFATSRPSATQIEIWFNSYVADDAINSGKDKAQQLSSWLSGDEGPQIGWKMTAVIQEPLDVSSTAYTKAYLVKIYIDNTAAGLITTQTSFVFNGQSWLFYGNRNLLAEEPAFVPLARMRADSSNNVSFQSGFDINVVDPTKFAYDHGVRSAVITGPGLPSNGVIMAYDFPDPEFKTYPQLADTHYFIDDDAVIESIANNAQYTIELCQETAEDIYNSVANCTALWSKSGRIKQRPLLNSELDADLFPTLVAPSAHSVSELNFGGVITISWNNPTLYQVNWIDLMWQLGADKYRLQASVDEMLSSGTLDATGLPLPIYGAHLWLGGNDEFGRRYGVSWSMN